MAHANATQHLHLVTTPKRREPERDTHPDDIPFPCPTCGAVFSRCGGGNNEMGVVELNLDCPNGHIWWMRYVSPSWTAGA